MTSQEIFVVPTKHTLHLVCIAALVCILSSGFAHAQVRSSDEQFDDIEQLFDVLRAVVQRINIDDEEVRSAEFPGRTLRDFDRNRNGQFMVPADAMGLFDLQLAIQQFNHDGSDADGDGLLGFIELECASLESGMVLDPMNPKPWMAPWMQNKIAMATG